MEDVIKVKEEHIEIQPTLKNRKKLSKAEADLKRLIKIEEDFWKQNAGIK